MTLYNYNIKFHFMLYKLQV